MGKPGFCIEFFAEVGEGAEYHERCRVLIVDERVLAFVAFTDPLGEMAWARVRDDDACGAGDQLVRWTAPLPENKIVALAFQGYIDAPERVHTKSHNGTTIIDIGFLQREP